MFFEDFWISKYNQTFCWEIKYFSSVSLWLQWDYQERDLLLFYSLAALKENWDIICFLGSPCKILSFQVLEAAVPLDLLRQRALTSLQQPRCAEHGKEAEGPAAQPAWQNPLHSEDPPQRRWCGGVKIESRKLGYEGIHTAGYFWVRWTGTSSCFCSSWQSRSQLAEEPQSRRGVLDEGKANAEPVFHKNPLVEITLKAVVLQKEPSVPTVPGMPYSVAQIILSCFLRSFLKEVKIVKNLKYLCLDQTPVAISRAFCGVDFHCIHHVAGNNTFTLQTYTHSALAR